MILQTLAALDQGIAEECETLPQPRPVLPCGEVQVHLSNLVMRHLTPDMLTAQRVMQAGRAVQSLTRTLGRVCIEPAEGCARRAPSTKPPHAAVGSLRTRELAAAVQRGAGDNSAGTGSDNDGFSKCVCHSAATLKQHRHAASMLLSCHSWSVMRLHALTRTAPLAPLMRRQRATSESRIGIGSSMGCRRRREQLSMGSKRSCSNVLSASHPQPVDCLKPCDEGKSVGSASGQVLTSSHML